MLNFNEEVFTNVLMKNTKVSNRLNELFNDVYESYKTGHATDREEAKRKLFQYLFFINKKYHFVGKVEPDMYNRVMLIIQTNLLGMRLANTVYPA